MTKKVKLNKDQLKIYGAIKERFFDKYQEVYKKKYTNTQDGYIQESKMLKDLILRYQHYTEEEFINTLDNFFTEIKIGRLGIVQWCMERRRYLKITEYVWEKVFSQLEHRKKITYQHKTILELQEMGFIAGQLPENGIESSDKNI